MFIIVYSIGKLQYRHSVKWSFDRISCPINVTRPLHIMLKTHICDSCLYDVLRHIGIDVINKILDYNDDADRITS